MTTYLNLYWPQGNDMRINIVCTDKGWIYSKFIEMFRKYSKHEIMLNKNDVPHQVVHYLPYYELTKKPTVKSTAWMSHQENRKDLHNKFVSVARMVDVPISQSKKYTEILKFTYGIGSVKQVITGVDLKTFKQRSNERPENEKLVVGYIGRQYSSSNRKNPLLLNKIGKLPFVELRVTGGNIEESKIPEFYAGLDIVVSPATIEGGPMAIQEAMAVGTPVMCFEGVGFAEEFHTGLIKIPFGQVDEFAHRLEVIWKTKSYMHFREAGVMNQMREQVKYQDWDNFVRKHDRIWESLV